MKFVSFLTLLFLAAGSVSLFGEDTVSASTTAAPEERRVNIQAVPSFGVSGQDVSPEYFAKLVQILDDYQTLSENYRRQSERYKQRLLQFRTLMLQGFSDAETIRGLRALLAQIDGDLSPKP